MCIRQTFVLSLMIVLSLALYARKRGANDDEEEEEDAFSAGRLGGRTMANYRGPLNHSQIAVYYKDNFQQPKCYGVVIDWTVIQVPCSCVIKAPTPDRWATWWDHRPKETVTKDDPSNYKALVFTYEHHSDAVKKMRMVRVTGIDVSPKCDTLFQYNVAKITLEKPIEGTKLAWVKDTNETRMQHYLHQALELSRLRGQCIVNYWSQRETFLDTPPKPIPMVQFLQKSEWISCESILCPKLPTPNKAERHQDKNVCNNTISRSRVCVNWESGDPLCRLIPGTPVFCNIAGLGLVGFIHNTSMYCDEVRGRHAIMEGIDLALHLIENDVPK